MEEPKRKSFLDVLKENLALADRFDLITRFVYIGNFKTSVEDVKKKMRASIKELNEEYGGNSIAGCLILYPTVFIHLIEASEELIYKHLSDMYKAHSGICLNQGIILPSHYNTYRLYFKAWHVTYIELPVDMCAKFDNFELEEVHIQIKNCLLKMYLISEYLMRAGNGSYQNTSEAVRHLNTDLPHCLPEVGSIEYLLTAALPFIPTVTEFLSRFENVPRIFLYRDRIWPPPISLVPYTYKKRLNLS